MYSFSESSKVKLTQADDRLQLIAFEAIEFIDFTVLETLRTLERQQELFNEGKAKTMTSKHLIRPLSRAIDVAPYPIDWDYLPSFYYLAGVWMSIAGRHNINLRWGGNWRKDNNFKDNDFMDLVHFEIVGV
jgi:peptidoglycan L-alanyl-D-glutamate endopeptidase CwlK